MRRWMMLILLAIAAASIGYFMIGRKKKDADLEVRTPAIYQRLSAAEARDMMADGNEYVLLDVRTEEEYQEQRIDGALLIPDHELTGRAEQELPDKEARIFIYCRSGRRSALAAKELIAMGYTNVYDFGGIIDWPYDTVKE